MKIEQQVVSLELAKRLKQLGVEQDSLFYWEWYITTEIRNETPELKPKLKFIPNKRSPDKQPLTNAQHYSAYTVAELGEMMKGKGMGVTAHSDMHDGWWVSGGEWIVKKQQQSHTVHGEHKWADCLAKMLIYLIENKLYNPKNPH